MEKTNDVQEILKELREKGWTLAAIADAIGSPHITVRKWWAGTYPENAPAVRFLLKSLLARRRIPKRKRYAGKAPVGGVPTGEKDLPSDRSVTREAS